jgi:hypothetical protein
MLADEFGASPGQALQALHQQILKADSSLTAPTPAFRGAPLPYELLADVSAFTGRAAEQAELDRLLAAPVARGRAEAAAVGRAVAAVAISGTAGVGNPNLEANTLDSY